ncbi:biotin--[acetyl-CoA-carboxylase] ligase [Tepidibacter formicigenes]|uniref:Bifunctional ligase/repressor BirA n=1 Tax=Tepidibacter formicigenes DSM 15518 TaxID=1123349 RepID=A0A1M6RUY8_9FIRM|nr:biotin--[acetyl-CoA-carboxylase] ligase [Tepidibacter formicigenes]SHK36311.1 BirA family transcriptional regulator, biotin operon repressor / biotin-[acetyl-CoA-carboxylase] ligase [Tepidibacter formicigenes DSM 15518]
MREKILNILLDKNKEFVSGEEISERLGITRSAVWKHIKNIKQQGYEIESVTKKGYKIVKCPDLLTTEIVKYNLNTNLLGKEVIYCDTIGSTNDYAKEIAKNAKEGTIIISEEQTKGRGRMGRYWHSIKGDGIWMSIILKPNIYPHEAPFITQIAGASIVSGLKKLGVNSLIKWPNDIIINNKKVSGILTELGAEIDRINYIVVGMGMNVKTIDFPENVKELATSIKKEGHNLKRIDILKSIIEEFEHLYLKYIQDKDKSECIKICRENSAVIGKNIYILKGEEKRKAKCVDITEEGNLVIINNNIKEELISGEVSIRGDKDYV